MNIINILFVAYSGHEAGLFGSVWFAKNIPACYKEIVLTINLDMVGRMDNKNTLFFDNTKDMEPEINSFFTHYTMVKCVRSPFSRINVLDSKWFAERNIPSLTFTTGMHPDYHKTIDDVRYVNFKGLLLVENCIKDYLTGNGIIK